MISEKPTDAHRRPLWRRWVAAAMTVLSTVILLLAQGQVLKKEYIYVNGKLVAIETAPQPGTPTVPGNFAANAASATRVDLTWSASSPGATYYQVERSSNHGSFDTIGVPGSTSLTDNNVSAATTYIYRVRAVNGSYASDYSAPNLATTIIFEDDPLQAGITTIRAVHLTQLRQAVNAVRTCAGLSQVTDWEDPSPSGVVIKAAHIQALRDQLGPGLTSLGFSPPSYTDLSITAGVTLIKKEHFQEIRQAVK